jgi:hypothetical protein
MQTVTIGGKEDPISFNIEKQTYEIFHNVGFFPEHSLGSTNGGE